MPIDRNIRLEKHRPRDLLVGRRSDGQRPGYQPPGRDYGGPPSRSSQPDTRGRDPTPSGPDRHPSEPKPAHTVAPTAQYDDRIQRIAAQDQRTAALRTQQLQNMRDPNYGQFLRPSPLIEKPTLGMRMRSGLGALGRGLGNIGNMAMMFNPFTAALGLAGKAPWLGGLLNIGSRYANQGGNWLNEFRQHDTLEKYLNRNKNQTTQQMDPELLKYFSGTEGIMDPNIFPEERPITDEMFTDENLMAGIKDMSVYQIKDFKALDLRDKMEKAGVGNDPLDDEEKQRLEKLRNLRNSRMISAEGNPIV